MKEFINQLGGIAAVAELTGAGKSAVSNWRLPGRAIPMRYRVLIAEYAKTRGVDLPAGYWTA